jgi:hypothetical protein
MSGHVSRSQVNSLLRYLLEIGVSIDALDLNADRESLKNLTIPLPFRLGARASSLFFQIEGHTLSTGTPVYKLEFFPGSRASAPQSEMYSVWEPVVAHFKQWAQRVRVELDEPDPWALVEQGRLLLGSIPTTDVYVDKFSENDLILVHGFLQRIRGFLVTELAPNARQLETIDERLRYLEDSAGTQDKKGWAYTAVGVVATIASALALSPEQGHRLFELTSELLKAIFIRLLT